jgi:hypothetical protein
MDITDSVVNGAPAESARAVAEPADITYLDRIPKKQRHTNPTDEDKDGGDEVTVVFMSLPKQKHERVAAAGRTHDDSGKDDVDDDDSMGSIEIFQNSNMHSLKKVPRHVAPKIIYSSSTRTLSAGFALANAIDDTLAFENYEVKGGCLVASLLSLLKRASRGHVNGGLLLEQANNAITHYLSPMYKYVAVEDEYFNIWQYSTTYPVAVLIPLKTHGVYKVHGFAVANNWFMKARKNTAGT